MPMFINYQIDIKTFQHMCYVCKYICWSIQCVCIQLFVYLLCSLEFGVGRTTACVKSNLIKHYLVSSHPIEIYEKLIKGNQAKSVETLCSNVSPVHLHLLEESNVNLNKVSHVFRS